MRKPSTLWIVGIIVTVLLCQPKTFLGFIGYTLVAAGVWSWILSWVFPEPSNMGGMPDSFKERVWNEYFGRDVPVQLKSAPAPNVDAKPKSGALSKSQKPSEKAVPVPFKNSYKRELARARARREMGE